MYLSKCANPIKILDLLNSNQNLSIKKMQAESKNNKNNNKNSNKNRNKIISTLTL